MNPAPTLDGMPVLWLRLPIAAVVVVVGSVRDWRPAIVIGAWLGLPVWHPVSPSVLVGVLAFLWKGPLLDRTPRPSGIDSGWKLPRKLWPIRGQHL